MHIHKYEKIWLIFGIGSLILFLAIIGVSAFTGLTQHPPSAMAQVDPEKVRETTPFDKPGITKIGEKEYEVVIVASAFNYDLGEAGKKIQVPLGSKVHFKVTTTDVIHGFEVAGTNTNMMIVPGHISEFTQTFKKTGEFTVLCNEYCGVGHHMMYAVIEVVE